MRSDPEYVVTLIVRELERSARGFREDAATKTGEKREQYETAALRRSEAAAWVRTIACKVTAGAIDIEGERK